MKMFLTYLLLIAPTVKTAAGISGVSVLTLWLMSWAVAGCGYRTMPGRFANLGAGLLSRRGSRCRPFGVFEMSTFDDRKPL
jgi:hypothetical protein